MCIYLSMIESRSNRKKEKSDETANKWPLTLRYGARAVSDLSLLDEMRFEARVWMRSAIYLEKREKQPESVKAMKKRSTKHTHRQSYPWKKPCMLKVRRQPMCRCAHYSLAGLGERVGRQRFLVGFLVGHFVGSVTHRFVGGTVLAVGVDVAVGDGVGGNIFDGSHTKKIE